MLRPSRKRQALRIGLGPWIGAFGAGGLIWGVWPLAVITLAIAGWLFAMAALIAFRARSYELHLDRSGLRVHDLLGNVAHEAAGARSSTRSRSRERLQLHRGRLGVRPRRPSTAGCAGRRRRSGGRSRTLTVAPTRSFPHVRRRRSSWSSGRSPVNSRNTIVGVDGQSSTAAPSGMTSHMPASESSTSRARTPVSPCRVPRHLDPPVLTQLADQQGPRGGRGLLVRAGEAWAASAASLRGEHAGEIALHP